MSQDLGEHDDAEGKKTKPDVDLPKGFTSEAGFLSHMRTEFADDIQADRLNREAGLEDIRFVIGDQWDSIVKARREAARKPVITVNRMPAFIGQVIGQRRQSETTINFIPDNGGTVAVARVREGLMRAIQKDSRADIAYDKALEGSVACGIGNFQVVLDWGKGDDVWQQNIAIEPINDHFAVVWDRTITDPSGRDAEHVFLVDTIKKAEFRHRWPWAVVSDIQVDVTIRGDLRMNGWMTVDDVRIVNYWRMVTKKRTVALMNDGSTQDITQAIGKDADPQAKMTVLSNIMQRRDGSPIMREVDRKFAEMYICSGADILEGPYQLPIDRVPIFRVPGWEMNVAETKCRWGLVRFLKDPQRLHNFSRSVAAEKMMQTPRAVWAASDTAVAGREQQWRNSHLTDDPLLIWNAESGNKPERVNPAQMEQAWLGFSELSAQDIKDVSNIHEANLGMPSNEVSGAAIVARQRVSDTGTVIYHDNLNQAIEECGRVVNDLIPIVYDTPRIVKVLGVDAKQDMQVINTMGDPRSIDITLGRYSITVNTGPNYATKRVEAAENMMNLANAMPQVLSVAADKIVEAQDWPGAADIAERIRMTMPPEMLKPEEMTPTIQAAQAQKQQQSQTQQQAAMQMAIANYFKTQSETTLNNARAQNFQATAEAVAPKLQNESMTAASNASAKELSGHLAAIKLATGG
jgi:hypothetical protein